MHTLYIITETICAISIPILYLYAIPKIYIQAMREAFKTDQPEPLQNKHENNFKKVYKKAGNI